MSKNLDSDSSTEIRNTRSGRTFREVPLVNLFKQSHEPAQEEGFYSGEEEELMNKKHLESVREEEKKTKEPRQEESETSRTTQSVELSIITPLVVLAKLSNQSNVSYQSTQRTGRSGLAHTQSRNLGRSMVDDMRLPTFR
jgi:hypothetical protein